MEAELLIKALQVIWQALRSMDVPAAVMGGFAMSLWKYPRATRDVDLLIGIDASQLDKILTQLRALEIRPKHSPPIISLGQLNIIQMLYEPHEAFMEVQIDLLLAETDYLRAALERRIPTRLPYIPLEIAVLTCEDLILHKLLAGRIIDRADVAALLRLNFASLDRNYLTHWVNQLQLTAEYTDIWQETFPNEPFPND
ncbi:MAG TPA: nucleotidyl transferase AbiEii/AbiGii toxin family protein [Thermoguttaceae bacterium]